MSAGVSNVSFSLSLASVLLKFAKSTYFVASALVLKFSASFYLVCCHLSNVYPFIHCKVFMKMKQYCTF